MFILKLVCLHRKTEKNVYVVHIKICMFTTEILQKISMFTTKLETDAFYLTCT